jgi:hypothetical protein
MFARSGPLGILGPLGLLGLSEVEERGPYSDLGLGSF